MKKGSLTGSMAAKTAAFMLAVITALGVAACAAAAVFALYSGMYTRSRDDVLHDYLGAASQSDAYTAVRGYLRNPDGYSFSLDGARCEMYDSDGELLYSDLNGAEYTDCLENTVYFDAEDSSYFGHAGTPDADGFYSYTVRIYLLAGAQSGGYYLGRLVLTWIYDMRTAVYFIGLGCLAAFIALFVFLMCASGRRAGCEEPVAAWGAKIPFEIPLFASGLIAVGCAALCAEVLNYGGFGPQLLLLPVCAAAVCAVFLALCMSFALRVKLGVLWKNTIACRLLRLAWRIASWVFEKCAWLWKFVSAQLHGLALVWKAALGYAALCLLELSVTALCGYDYDNTIAFLIVERLLLAPVVIAFALGLRRLQSAGRALAAGDLSYKVDLKYLPGDLRGHGSDLNSIANGMTLAVEERLKSERLKTELITNVSHDIKTPLTSIINYSDLISREQCDNERIREYSAVLLRQSERLKRLIEDLVAASKASTGNVEVCLAPCEAGVMLTQAEGEYSQRLHECGLELVTRRPEEPVQIMADSRHMMRIVDNLMVNICKYALSGTRVYITLERADGFARISFKNISRCELDISADELMERFVRGDRSRSTEGSGLGLSIARSLTELQGGHLELSVDGDLFKAVLVFPIIGEKQPPAPPLPETPAAPEEKPRAGLDEMKDAVSAKAREIFSRFKK